MHKPSWRKGSGKAVFQYLGKLFELKTFIETGTGFGDTLAFMHRVYDQCYSIEAHRWKYELCCEMFQYTPNVELLFGSSHELLPDLLKRIPNLPTFFWLDAHDQPGVDDGPLALELAAILYYRPDALIAIDDVGPDTHHDINLSRVKASHIPTDDLVMDYRFDRVMFIHRGQYQIPDLD